MPSSPRRYGVHETESQINMAHQAVLIKGVYSKGLFTAFILRHPNRKVRGKPELNGLSPAHCMEQDRRRRGFLSGTQVCSVLNSGLCRAFAVYFCRRDLCFGRVCTAWQMSDNLWCDAILGV